MDRMDQEFEQKVTKDAETALRGSARTKRKGPAGSITSITGTAPCSRPKEDRQPPGCPEGLRSAVKAACRVVWEGWQAQSCHPDPIRPGWFSPLGWLLESVLSECHTRILCPHPLPVQSKLLQGLDGSE